MSFKEDFSELFTEFEEGDFKEAFYPFSITRTVMNGWVSSTEKFSCQASYTSMNLARYELSENLPDGENIKCKMKQENLNTTPVIGEQVSYMGSNWTVVSVDQDPLQITFTVMLNKI